MKYTNEVTINKPIDTVIALFDNVENMYKWQPGLKSFETIEGEQGEVGAKSLLKYDMGNRKVEMIETITVKNLPHEFAGTYEAKGVFNEIKNSFVQVDDQTTKWVSENVFHFKGFMKIMAFLMPGAFKKQSQKYLDLFKAFAESQ